jgi:glycosyltransferase involved in cell wall biosynthesis
MEAMVMGVPILAPDLDFARYVCGEAACYYDPWNTETAFEKILLLREDATIRQKLIDKGKTQLANRSQFAENWEEVAKDLIQDLRALAEKR